MLDLLVRYGHFVAIFVLFAMLSAEHMLVKSAVEPHWMKKIALFDTIYGASALCVLLFGLGLWWWVGKPAVFYTHNPVFHAKVGLFVLAGLLSFIPTRFYLKHRHDTQPVLIPKSIIMVIRLELTLLLIVALLAVLMAQGVGLNGFFNKQI